MSFRRGFRWFIGEAEIYSVMDQNLKEKYLGR